MADRTDRSKNQVHHAHVVRTEQLPPHRVRVVLGGPGLADFEAGEYTDHYVKLLFPVPGVEYPEPFDIAARSLIRSVRSGASDRLISTMYSK